MIKNVYYKIPDLIQIHAELPQVCRMETVIIDNEICVFVAHENGMICKFSNIENKNTFIGKNKSKDIFEEKHKSIITQLRYEKEYEKLLTCSADHTVKIWNLKNNKSKINKCEYTITDKHVIWDCLTWKDNIVYGTDEGKIKIFNLEKQKIVNEFIPFEDFIEDVAFFLIHNKSNTDNIINRKKSIFSIDRIKNTNMLFISGDNNFMIYNIKNHKKSSKINYFNSYVKYLDNNNKKVYISGSKKCSEFNIKTRQFKDLKIESKKYRAMNGIYYKNWFLFNNSNNQLIIYNLVDDTIKKNRQICRNIHKFKLINNKIALLTSC